MPTVSVVIITKDRPEWLRKAVASVITQTWGDWHCIVVDNGNSGFRENLETVTAAMILGDIAITANPEVGDHSEIARSRNLGASFIWGDYLLFLDDDDVLTTDALETLLRPLEARPHLSGSYGFPYLMSASGERMTASVGHRPRGGELYLSDLAINMNMVSPPGCALIRRSAFEACGAWDETGEVRESVEIFQRLLRVGPMACVPQEVLGYRQHPCQLSKKRNLDMAQYVRTTARLNALLTEEYGI